MEISIEIYLGRHFLFAGGIRLSRLVESAMNGSKALRFGEFAAETAPVLIAHVWLDAEGRVCKFNFESIDGKHREGSIVAYRLGLKDGEVLKEVQHGQ